MSVERTLAFLAFAVAMAGTPGPSNALLTATGARVGVLRGLPALFGVAVGMAVLLFVVTFGLGAVLLGAPVVVVAVKWLGALVLLWFAWQIGTSGASVGTPGTRPIGFFGAAGFQWINPKSWLACTSAAGAYVDLSQGSALVQAATLAALFAAAAVVSCLPWLAFGAGMQRLLRSERSARLFNLLMAALLVISVVLLVS